MALHSLVLAGTLFLAGLLAGGVTLRTLALLAVLIALAHGVQDLAKERLADALPEGRRADILVADQVLHLAVITGLTALFGLVQVGGPLLVFLASLRRPPVFAGVALVVAGTWAAGIFLREALDRFLPEALRARPGADASRLDLAALEGAARPTFADASFWIGIVERVIVIAAIALGGAQGFAAAGLVVAAKSVFRWRAIGGSRDAVQYFLLGSLSSVAVAVLSGLLLSRLIA